MSEENNATLRDFREQAIQSAIIGERYKYIVGELSRLNSNAHRNLNLFKTVAPILLTPAFYIAFFMQKAAVPAQHIENLMLAIFVIITALGLFIVLSIIADTLSWMDCRREEMALLSLAGFPHRNPPRWANFWRWQETYAVLLIVIFIALSYALLFKYALPALIAT
jgi:hypothetical protein